ncbi:MAG TPA: hypothetical protein VGQ83_17965 [Polyangia bacterium]|jgi:hypothetical protein
MNGRARRPVVLTDFDGVWTEVAGQAAAVDAARGAELRRLSGWTAAALDAVLADVDAAIAASPATFGWMNAGRVTAFADEDPFLRHNGRMSGIGALAAAGHAGARALRDALAAAGAADLGALGSAIFTAASEAFLAGAGHALRPGAREVLGRLLERAEVVVCTNFATAGVAATLTAHGFPVDSRTGASRGAPGLRLIGGARKQELGGPAAVTVDLGGRAVAVDRPCYRQVLAGVRPDIVVGDVLSLDLAVPLSGHGLDAAPRCLLALAPHTPAWARALAADGCGGRLRPLGGLEELLADATITAPAARA